MQMTSMPYLDKRFLELSVQQVTAAYTVIAKRYGSYRERHFEHNTNSPIILHSATCGAIGVSTLTFGRAIEIEPDDLASSLLVMTTLKGQVELVTGHAHYGGGPGSTVISEASDKPRFHYNATGEVLKIQLDHRRVSAACWRLLQRQGTKPLRFETAMRDSNVLRRWFMLLHFLVTTLNDSDPALLDCMAPGLEEALTFTLLDTQQHNYTSKLRMPSDAIAPRQLRRAVEFMETRLEQPQTLAQIASEAGCSIRSLSRAFKQFRHTTPMKHLNHLRLEKVRARLLEPLSSGETIVTIALHYGFSHLSAFNLQYKRLYGETPSQTRNRVSNGVF